MSELIYVVIEQDDDEVQVVASYIDEGDAIKKAAEKPRRYVDHVQLWALGEDDFKKPLVRGFTASWFPASCWGASSAMTSQMGEST